MNIKETIEELQSMARTYGEETLVGYVGDDGILREVDYAHIFRKTRIDLLDGKTAENVDVIVLSSDAED